MSAQQAHRRARPWATSTAAGPNRAPLERSASLVSSNMAPTQCADGVTTLQLDTVYDCGDGYDPSNLFSGLAGSNCESGNPAGNTRTARGQHAPFNPPYCIASKKRLLAFRSQGPPSPPPHHRQIPVAWAHHSNAVALPCRTRALADSAVNPNIGGDDEWMALVSHAHSLNITVTSFWNAA